MAITTKLREAIFSRDGYRCVACLTANSLTIQHRVSKGMGGSKKFDTPAFLITMCLSCNIELESNPEKAELGRGNGWKLSRNAYPAIDPETVPVKMGQRWFYLDNQMNLTEMRNNA